MRPLTFARHRVLRFSLALCAWAVMPDGARGASDETTGRPTRQAVRFGMTADPHLMGRNSPDNEAKFQRFVEAMIQWKPDFAIDLGDFACQVGDRGGVSTPQLHDGQLRGLIHHVAVFSRVPCPRYNALGNHDVGWLRGGDERIKPEDLNVRPHGGEDITKAEFVARTGIPHRYYGFDVKGVHFIVLDGNNSRDASCPEPAHDGVAGGYHIDAAQKVWLKKDLTAHRDQLTVVFSHQELHHTPKAGSREGGDVPFPPIGKEGSYIDNGWQIREMFRADGKVLVCFAGHKHRNRWTVHGGVNYITLAATHWHGSFAKVTIADTLKIDGFGRQRSYVIPLGQRVQKGRAHGK